jgi:hypothetical protein
VPSTFATHTPMPFTSASITSPGFGASFNAHNLTQSDTFDFLSSDQPNHPSPALSHSPA